MSRFVLDCAISRPPDEQLVGWLATALQRGWASPRAGYHEGKLSVALLEQSASTLARLVGARSARFAPDPASAVACALTELLAVPGPACVATSAVDTAVVQQTSTEVSSAHRLAHLILDVDSDGAISPSALERLPTPAIVVTNLGNQEIGTVQIDLAAWARRTGSSVVLDASTAFGWVDLPDSWSHLVLDARAWGAPPGATAVCSAAAPRTNAFDNVPAAVVAGLAAERWAAQAPTARAATRAQAQRIAERVTAEIRGVEVRGATRSALPHILSISVLYVDAEAVQSRLDAHGFAVGSGSACASRSGQPSHVLAAVGGLTSGNLRIGLPPGLEDGVADLFVDTLVSVVAEVREQMGTQDL